MDNNNRLINTPWWLRGYFIERKYINPLFDQNIGEQYMSKSDIASLLIEHDYDMDRVSEMQQELVRADTETPVICIDMKGNTLICINEDGRFVFVESDRFRARWD